jgi:Ca-activated chloride channel family protein
MRNQLVSILLGTSLLTAACSKKLDQAVPAAVAVARDVASASPNSRAPSAGSGNAASSQGKLASGALGTPADDTSLDRGAARSGPQAASTESYHDWGQNPWTDTAKDHLSTFAADVDTASYTLARRKLNTGELPAKAGVRVEELVNYFKYAFGAPQQGTPFAVVMDAAPSPVAPGRDILRVGVATKAKSIEERAPAHLVFLVDVSGSMSSPDKLELAKQSLRILVDNLKDGDTVAIVTYAGDTRLVLPASGLDHKDAIVDAIDGLHAGGSTAMASGIDLAYDQAIKGATPGAIARVLVLTDGDANVGAHTHGEILKLIESRTKQGVTLSTIGFGMGNYKDDLMEQLADHGNGNNFYIDGPAAAHRVFQEQLGSTLEVVAKDVKLQVDFDPRQVAQYRLIGYEDRDVADEDFRNDAVDAGEIGAGHQVTAMYEIERTAAGKLTPAPLATLRVRYKAPNGDTAKEAAFPMAAPPAAQLAQASDDLRFAFAVAAFADVLRGGQDAEHWGLPQIRALAAGAAGRDPDRAELVGLIDKAIAIGSTKTASR